MRNILQQTFPDYSNLVGVPYSDMNCWDIAVAFYKNVFNIDMRSIYDGPTPERSISKNIIYTNLGEFDKVESPEFGDIILLKILGIESHIAIYLGNDRMLHSSKSTGSVIDFVSRWKKVIVGFYRVKRQK